MILKRLVFYIFVILIHQTAAQAQEWISYQSPQQINDLVDTGYELRMATDAGLVVMNKSTLEKTVFNKANSSLSNNHIQTITIAPNGDAWIGTYDVVLARFDGSDFTNMTSPDIEEFNQYTELYDFKIAPNGDFWIGTSDGIFHRQGQTWSHYDQDELGDLFFKAWDIEINEDGEVFIGSNAVYKYADGIWSNISDTTQLLAYINADIFFSEAGDLYFAGDLDRIGRFDGEQWQEYDNGGLNGSQVIGFTEDTDGNVYFNTQMDGIFKLVNNSWTLQTNEQTEAFNNHSSFFYIDAQNNHWLNNNIYLSRSENGNIQSTSISQHSIEYDNVSNIHKGENGHLYFIMYSSTNSIAEVDPDGNWSLLSLPSSLDLGPFLEDILFLADDDIWLASFSGLHHYNGSDWTSYELEACRSFALDSQGKIYARATDRIYLVDNGVITNYNTSNSPIATGVISGHGVDAYDNLWIAAFDEDVIQRVSPDGTWTTYTETEHVAINQPNGQFHFDHEGNVWVPSDLVGAIKFDGTSWTNPILDNQADIENYHVFSIASKASGTVYFAHQYGVTTLTNGEWGSLNIEDIPNIFSSHSSTIQFDDEGTLWWASNRYGVFSYTPAITSTSFSGFDQPTPFSIYPNPAQDFTILDFTLQESANVEAIIYNQLGQWIAQQDFGPLPAGAIQRRIDLAHLPKGAYTIQLRINDYSVVKKIILQ